LLARTVDLVADLLTATGIPDDEVGELLLLGGSSRIPLVATLLHGWFGFGPAVSTQPDLAVAEGALAAVSRTHVAPADPGVPSMVVAGEPARPEPEPSTVDLALSTVDLAPSTPELTSRPAAQSPAAQRVPAPAADALVASAPAATAPVAGALVASAPAATAPVAGAPVAAAGRRRRPTGPLVMAVGLVCVVVLAGWYAIRQPPPAVSGGPVPTGTHATASGPDAGVLGGAPATGAPVGPAPRDSASAQTTPTPSASDTPTPAATPGATATPTTGTAPVVVSVAATPTSGTCSTDITFVAHFTLNSAGKYRWHWVFGGPGNYSSTSGDHDQDKTGDVRITKKFGTGGSGTYWGQVQITAPYPVVSGQASVEVTCPR
jgi:hypothetical protein